MAHELITAFDAVGLGLCNVLREMLDEHPKHRTERRGCGLTQATRFLADRINHPRDALDTTDLAILSSVPQQASRAVAARSVDLGWVSGWRGLADAPAVVRESIAGLPAAVELLSLQHKLAIIDSQIMLEESKLLLALVTDILSDQPTLLPGLPGMPEKPEIGSCSQAEEYFLEIAHGKLRRGGRVNVLVDADYHTVLIEKMNLGESHSAVFLQKASICGVAIPPGGLAALRYRSDAQPIARHERGDMFALSALAEVRFLRLTTLAVAPHNRERAFSTQFRRQVVSNMLSPATTTLDDLRVFAANWMQAA